MLGTVVQFCKGKGTYEEGPNIYRCGRRSWPDLFEGMIPAISTFLWNEFLVYSPPCNLITAKLTLVNCACRRPGRKVRTLENCNVRLPNLELLEKGCRRCGFSNRRMVSWSFTMGPLARRELRSWHLGPRFLWKSSEKSPKTTPSHQQLEKCCHDLANSTSNRRETFGVV